MNTFEEFKAICTREGLKLQIKRRRGRGGSHQLGLNGAVMAAACRGAGRGRAAHRAALARIAGDNDGVVVGMTNPVTKDSTSSACMAR